MNADNALIFEQNEDDEKNKAINTRIENKDYHSDMRKI